VRLLRHSRLYGAIRRRRQAKIIAELESGGMRMTEPLFRRRHFIGTAKARWICCPPRRVAEATAYINPDRCEATLNIANGRKNLALMTPRGDVRHRVLRTSKPPIPMREGDAKGPPT